MEISDNYRISLSVEELDLIVKEKIVQLLRDTERSVPELGLIHIEYQIDHDADQVQLTGADVDINLPWEKEQL